MRMLKLTCSRCHENPRASLKSHRCLACEREYWRANQAARAASSRKSHQRHKDRIRERHEQRIEWWMTRSAAELVVIKNWYAEQDRQLPRAYETAMGRIAKRRSRADQEYIARLPNGLSKAVERHRKANLSGSRPSDYRAARFGG